MAGDVGAARGGAASVVVPGLGLGEAEGDGSADGLVDAPGDGVVDGLVDAVGCGPVDAVPLGDGVAEEEGAGDAEAVAGAAGSQFTALSSLLRSPMIRSASSRLAAGRVFESWDRWYSGRFDTGMSVVS